jgi:hypothetical protein
MTNTITEPDTVEPGHLPTSQTIATGQPPTAASSIFDNIEDLKLSNLDTVNALVEPVRTYVPVCKPSRERWFMLKEGTAYQLDALILELKEEGETLFVLPHLEGAVLGEKCIGRRILRLGVTRQGVAFIWPIRPPMADRADAWASTALDAAAHAEKHWTRMTADMGMGGYRISIAKVDDEPTWPKESFGELLKIAFKNSIVDSLDHPTLRRLRGEV